MGAARRARRAEREAPTAQAASSTVPLKSRPTTIIGLRKVPEPCTGTNFQWRGAPATERLALCAAPFCVASMRSTVLRSPASCDIDVGFIT